MGGMTLHRFERILPLAAAVWLAAGCAGKGSVAAGKSQAAVASGVDTARASAAADTGPGYVYRDSADVFDPDGYYSPVDTLRLGGYLLEPLELHSVDYYYEGQVHHDRPRVLVPPQADFGLTKPGDEGIASNRCRDVRISRDSVSLSCPGTAVGDVTLAGRFLVKAQTFFASPYDDDATPVLSARVTVRRDGRVVHDAVHAFKYTSGD